MNAAVKALLKEKSLQSVGEHTLMKFVQSNTYVNHEH